MLNSASSFDSLSLLAPELFLLIAICAVLVVDVFSSDKSRRITYLLTLLSLGVTALICMTSVPETASTAFAGHLKVDALGSLLKVVICLVVGVGLLYCREYMLRRGLLTGEFFLLALFSTLGMMVLVSAGSMLTVYLGLELMSLSLYAMVALDRDSAISAEAAMKYFVLGALASGLLLYGMSLIYGVTGTIELAEMAAPIVRKPGMDIVLGLGLVFVVVGIAFKLGAVPFHMWVPDVYQGAPTAVTLFIGTAPKIAAFGMAIRLLADGLQPLSTDWTQMLAVLAIVSMAVGNVVAIAQTNLKRMLAYSTISHVGFLLLGIIAGTQSGYAASMFYAVVYSIMALGTFGMIIVLGNAGFESDRLEDFRGLAKSQPWLALMMMFLMLSMAGVPPFLGFWGKWYVLLEVVRAQDLWWLAPVAVAFAVIGLFYYLRMIKLMWFDAPPARSLGDEVATPLAPVAGAAPPIFGQTVVSANALFVLVFGLFPGGLMALCISAFAG